eukprot:TRINITY_DN1678_c0_g1_i3.p1 TRINITY_DN1678_c0_g1~~TRINITY_DN1678_c0_g1_i3.p1  ORF type:complete len:418 (+),score=103.47 TRINITY_DN1678_c0_g1_i3:223-1476(+)
MSSAFEKYTFLQDVWLSLSDPGTMALLAIPLFVITLGSYLSVNFYSQLSGGSPGMQQAMQEQQNIVSKYAILLPIIGSVVLVFLFWFLDLVYYIFLLLLMFASFSSMCFVLSPFFEYLLLFSRRRIWGRIPLAIPTVECIGKLPVDGLCAALVAASLIITFLFTNSFWLTNVFGICIGIFGISSLRIPSLKIASIMLWGFFFYDVFWVFISPYIFGKNVMVTVALSVTRAHWNLPILIQIPRLLSDGPSMLGMGDIFIPGLFLAFLYRFDMEICGSPCRGYYLNAAIGYFVGMVTTFLMLTILEMAQPALLYLVPGTMLPTLILGWSRGQLRHLWEGKPPRALYILPVVTGRDEPPCEVAGGDAQVHGATKAFSVAGGEQEVSSGGGVDVQIDVEERDSETDGLVGDYRETIQMDDE